MKSNNLKLWIREKGDSFSGKPRGYPVKGKKSEAVDLTKPAKIPLAPKKKKLTSKLTVVSKQLHKEATKAAKKMGKAQKPKQKGVLRPKKIDMIDLTGLKKTVPKIKKKEADVDLDDLFDFSEY